MIKLNGKKVDINHFPDGTMLLKERVEYGEVFCRVVWLYENNEELTALIFLKKHLERLGFKHIELLMPYIPNARQDRVKSREDVFTLKYFADVINWLGFETVQVIDPHSTVSEALINNIEVKDADMYIRGIICELCDWSEEPLLAFYPDEGAMKRYSAKTQLPYAFGIKQRDWSTGQIKGLEVSGMVEKIPDSRILIIDDICSRGGTFYHSAKKLKELGAKEIYLYITHCENTILDGELLSSGLIERVYTTDDIFTKSHDKIEIVHSWR